MSGNCRSIFLVNRTVYQHAIFIVLVSNEFSSDVSTHLNAKMKPGK